MYCPNCGNEIRGNQKFCGNCGAEVLNTEVTSQPEANGFNTAAKSKLLSSKKKSKRKIIIPIIAAAVAVSLLAGAFSFVLKDRNKWCCVEKTVTSYNSQGEKDYRHISSYQTDGKIVSELDEYNGSTEKRVFTYDDKGRFDKISLYEDDKNICVIALNYEKEDGNYVAESTATIDGERVTFKRIYNEKNVLIYESESHLLSGEENISISEKEYNDRGQLLKDHFKSVHFDELDEYKYEKNKLVSHSYYRNNELGMYYEYDKKGCLVKFEFYNEEHIFDWSKSEVKSDYLAKNIPVGGESKYNKDHKLVYETSSKFFDNTVEVYLKFYDYEERKDFEEEHDGFNENEPFITATLNDKKMLRDIYVNGEKDREFKYDENNNLLSDKHYDDGEISFAYEYKWSKK